MNKHNARDYLPLVQALAEGKTIQVIDILDGGWIDIHSMDLGAPANNYRIKPEPREVYMNCYSGRLAGTYSTIEDAKHWGGDNSKQVLFREVFESSEISSISKNADPPKEVWVTVVEGEAVDASNKEYSMSGLPEGYKVVRYREVIE